MLDRDLKLKLRALADADTPVLDRAAQLRIARRVAAQAPRIMRRARAEWALAHLGGAALAAAAVAAVFVGYASLDQRGSHQGPAAAPLASPSRQCETRRLPPEPERHFVTQRDDARVLALGTQTFVSNRRSDVIIERTQPCETRLALRSGQLRVDGTHLGGGEIVISTLRGRLLTRGARFTMNATDHELTVAVAEGTVSLQGPGNEKRELAAGARATF